MGENDPRQNFIADWATKMLRIKPDRWGKALAMEENRAPLAAFLDNPEPFRLVIGMSGAGGLFVQNDFPANLRSKCLYFVKKPPFEAIPRDNFRAKLMFGDLNHQILDQLSALIDEVITPLLSNEKNTKKWTSVVSSDIMGHVHELKSTLTQVYGQMKGKTVLPLPVGMDRLLVVEQTAVRTGQVRDTELLHSIETMVIKWVHQVAELLQQDPTQFSVEGRSPGPSDEITFWRDRYENLESVQDQLNQPAMRRMTVILEKANSSYYSALMKIIRDVTAAVAEAQDITTYLRPLDPYLQELENAEFSESLSSWRLLLLGVCLVWANSEHYSHPARIVVLLQSICNLLIEQGRSFVDCMSVFQSEIPDSLDKINKCIKTLKNFRSSYEEYKRRLPDFFTNRPPKLWEFSPQLVFNNFDRFVARLETIKVLFDVATEFVKLEKVELGGVKGRALSALVADVYQEFIDSYGIFSTRTYDCLDPDCFEFIEDLEEMNSRIEDFDLRLASIFSQGFEDCATGESVFKMLDMFGALVERPVIKADIIACYPKLVAIMNSDMDNAKIIFNSRMRLVASGTLLPVHKNQPPVAGTVKWCQELRQRITAPMNTFRAIENPILESDEAKLVEKKFQEMTSLLNNYEEKTYKEWADNVDAVCQVNLNLPLLVQHGTKIAMNFDPKLIAVLREVKYLTFAGKTNIPASAANLYERLETIRQHMRVIEHLCAAYNTVREEVMPVEAALIAEQVDAINATLDEALTSLTWENSGVWEYIEKVNEMIRDLEDRVYKSKANLDQTQLVIASWSRVPLFIRKEEKKDALLSLDDRTDRVNKRYNEFKASGIKLHDLTKDSFVLFKVEATNPAWLVYEDYIDGLIIDGLVNCIINSLNVFVENMDSRLTTAPFMEARLDLIPPDIIFTPSMNFNDKNSVVGLMEGLINDIFNQATLVERITSHRVHPHYLPDMTEVDQLVEMQNSCIEHMRSVMQQVLEFSLTWEKYTYLWTDNRQEFLEYFLETGRPPGEDLPPLPEGETKTGPTLVQFQQQIDGYEQLYVEVEQMVPSEVFENWFRLDMRPFKQALMNTIKRWSHMFKQHLVDHVTTSLQDLDNFIKKTADRLGQPLEEGDYHGLVDTMEMLQNMRERTAHTDAMFEPIQQMIDLLRSYEQELPEEVHHLLQELPEKWTNTKKQAVQVKQQVAPLQANEVANIRRKCAAFDTRQIEYREKFRTYEVFKSDCEKVYPLLNRINEEILDLESTMLQNQDAANLFEVVVPEYKQLKQCRKELKLLKQLWDYVSMVRCTMEEWKKTLWKDINVENMDTDCKKFAKDLRGVDKEVKNWDVYLNLDATVRNMMTSLRAVGDLQNPAIRQRHWRQLMLATKVKFVMDEYTTLADLLKLNLHNFEDDVRNIVDKAVKEMGMEKTLRDLNNIWTGMEFDFEPHLRTGLQLVKVGEELMESLEENQAQLQNLMTSKYIAFFLEEVSGWQQKLSMADQVISAWMEVQRTWTHLESIFVGSEDIRKQLPEDSKRFDYIDKTFKKLMEDMQKTPNVIKGTSKHGLYEQLEKLHSQLMLCEKALADYLDTKRLAFPRFYFVSSADLLDILSNGNQPELVAKHLTKLFDSMASLLFNLDPATKKNTKVAHSMAAKDGEVVIFDKECDCTGQVEHWLTRLLEVMRSTIRWYMTEAVVTYEEKPREFWLFDYPAQVALCGTQIWWTTEVNAAFARLEEGYENAMKEYFKKQVQQLNTLITMLLGDLTPIDRQKIMTICTIDVHARDVVNKMIVTKLDNAQAFTWQSQLRHRWDDHFKDCFANICDAQFRYSHEYLGCTPRLVITPLTDRCYITLTQSLHLIMGGGPAGPAGTGKTETTKDLGRALGIMVYVFNCSEQMDYKSMGDIYKGLAQTGAWGCFDEFNRITVEVLSVVAVQVKCLQDAIRDKKEFFNFQGEVIRMIPTVGLWITMNPGYAGRTELPENLKVLFRPCAMVVPDFELISEIMLVAEGFLEARVLARKFITLYTLCKELLSKQDHYDWGLRAIKSVLVVAGSLKRMDPTRPEDQVLMRALRDFNIPKIVTDDMPVFMGLIGDLFPALDVPRKRDPEFEKTIRAAALELYLQPDDGFILKVVQLQELLNVRHSVFIIGNAGTGKSQVWKALIRTYQIQKRKPVVYDLDPKAVTNDELFGIINPATREWKDGLFSVLMRDMANLTGESPKWLMLDGDIDPMWIESLNTTMDDNKVLTLASNERIALTKHMRLIFEIQDLKTATPATVSRAGILYINPQDLGWNPFVTSWIDTREFQSEKANLIILFDRYIPACLDAVKTRYKKITPITDMSHIQMVCHLLEILLTPENAPPDSPKELYELYFVFACLWGFGSALFQDQIADHRAEFSKWWVSEFKVIKFPAQGTIFDYFIDYDTKRFLPWTDKVPAFELDPEKPLQAVLVHTAETTRISFFLDSLIEKRRPVMLVGNAGCGKTVLINDKLRKVPQEKFVVTNVPFNFYTTSEMLQKILEKPLEKKAGRNYGPPGSKRLIYFVDDMNMPEVDVYFTVQPHTLIRQHMEYSHWYDRNKLTLKEIHNCQYLSCMNPTAGSFTITPRLQRHFCTFALSFPSPEALVHIYSSILSQHLADPMNKFTPGVQKMSSTVVTLALAMHARVCQSFLPTAIKFHYMFNLRDLSNIFQGLLFANGDCLKNPPDIVRLWMHEAQRVYRDKMIDSTDNEAFNKIQLDAIRKNLEEVDESIHRQPVLYCHFALGPGEVKYMPVSGWAHLGKLLKDSLHNYNEVNAAMNLVLFEDAIQHICRINRILESPRGNALLVGVGGSGKQSLARLSSFISALDVFQITLKKGYGIPDLKLDLGALCLKAGLKNIGTVFLMTDAQVAEEKFLVLINDLLASGDIPDLLPEDEVENIISGVRNEVKASGQLDTRENCWKFYIERVQRQLKVVLCFSPVGITLRVRSRKFPAVVNSTAIDWFHEWPEEALISVSQRFLGEMKDLPIHLHGSISRFMAFVHMSVNDISKLYLQNDRRYNYTTPKSFLEQIILYSTLLSKKFAELKNGVVRLENGLAKLRSTSAQVDDLKDKLAVQEIELQQKNEAADQLIQVVGVETEKVTREKAVADEEEAKVAVINVEVSKKQRDCEQDLLKAEPALVAAQEALNTLNKNNLTELKSFGSPPAAAVNVVAAVMVLMTPPGSKVPKDRSWKACKIMMAKVDQFLDDLINFKKENIAPEVLKAIRPYLADPEFNAEFIRSKSAAAAGLCSWVINVIAFYEVYCDVEPKRKALEHANAELAAAQEKLSVIKAKIQKLEEALQILTTQFEKATSEKLRCQQEASATAGTINLANRLVGGLASENVRWAASVASMEEQATNIPGDVLLITAFISYVGCFTKKYRVQLMDNLWVPYLKGMQPIVPITPELDPLQLLTDDAQIATWNNEGLPNDRMSTENATILTNSQRWPLMIDPQLQGIKWIKTRYGSALRVIRLGSKGYIENIEAAISAGKTVMIESIGENVDAVLDHVLGRNTIRKGKAIKIGDKEVEYHPKFYLVLQTKLANPHYKPEMQAQTTLINFTVTRDGLEDQLLAEVVRAERPDLEQLKAELTRQQNEFKILLKELEDSLLNRLSSATGNILGDTSLVENLEFTKKTAATVEVKVAEAKRTELQINESREIYRPSAARASILYFILNEMNKINPMYQFSLKAFNVVFHRAIEKAEPGEDVKTRVINLIDSITFSVYQYTARGLFEQDKIVFTSQLTIQVLSHAKDIPAIELDFLLRYPFIPNLATPVDFLTNMGWGGIKALSNMNEFPNLDKDIEGSAKRWKKFIEGEAPERDKFPQEWKNKSTLQRMCMLRAMRPDRMTYAMLDFVSEKMGVKYVEGRSIEFAKSWEESGPSTPMFFILSPGVDPLKDVEALGKKIGFTFDSKNFHNVSLGQGQEVVAEAAMDTAAKQGHWVILQNVHLVARWLPTLEKKIEAYSEGSHPSYRLYVSAEPSADPAAHIIPQGILENSIKITNEPPTGIKANLHKALDNFDQETLEMCSKEAEFKSILFSLCYFHAVVSQRRKFGPQGWNRSYPFNVGDLTICANVLFNYLEANPKVPWVDLRFLFGEIMYGGHITDDWDRRLCRVYFEEYVKPEQLEGELYLAPGFQSPPSMDYKGYHQYIDDLLPPETPSLYGLHPNAEIGFLTVVSERMFRTVFEMQPRDAEGGGGAAMSREEKIKQSLDEIMEKLPEEFNLMDLMSKTEDRSPYIVVALQECERMNILTREIRRSLKELDLGLKGELSITFEMEKLSNALFMETIADSWTKKAYPSLYGLGSWYADLLLRIKELEIWTGDFQLPPSVWLAGFFNPQSFLTSIMQTTARKNEMPLDKMCLTVEVTKKFREEFTAPPREGSYIHGLFMEGARWDIAMGTIAESNLKELFPMVPVIFVKAIHVDKLDLRNMYDCPVYKTRARGPTFVWTFNLRTKEKAAKWVLGGVCLLLMV